MYKGVQNEMTATLTIFFLFICSFRRHSLLQCNPKCTAIFYFIFGV